MVSAIDGLVISGGAAKGAAFLGVLHRLSEMHVLGDIRAISGTSIGALAAVLVAKKTAMIDALHMLSRQPFTIQADLMTFEPPFGLDSGHDMLEFIRCMIGQQSFNDLKAQSGVDVVICATSLFNKKPVYFQADTHPNMEVAWAVRLSCTLPLLFAYGQQDDDAFVDGGLTDNFPVSPLVQKGCKRILGLRFKAPDPLKMPSELTEYVMALMTCVAWQAECQDDLCEHVVELAVPQHAAFDFSMCPRTLKGLFELGYNTRLF